MTGKPISLRGYDDSPYLKEMADGIITRRFASVEEAAKTVLGEEAGSNVDRLRRKFREQNWYERGLNDYVEAEINRRAADAPIEATEVEFLTSSGRPMSKTGIVVAKTVRRLTDEIAPTATLGFFRLGVTAALAAIAMRPTSVMPILTPSLFVSVIGMMIWASRAAAKATPIQAGLHLATMISFSMAMIVGLKMAVPDPSFTAGSLPGTAAIALATLVIANYVCELVAAFGRRSGKAKSPEIFALSAMIAAVGGLGFLPVINDFAYANKRTEQGIKAYEQVAEVYNELRKKHPDIDLEPLMDVQKQIVKDAVRFPAWVGE